MTKFWEKPSRSTSSQLKTTKFKYLPEKKRERYYEVTLYPKFVKSGCVKSEKYYHVFPSDYFCLLQMRRNGERERLDAPRRT